MGQASVFGDSYKPDSPRQYHLRLGTSHEAKGWRKSVLNTRNHPPNKHGHARPRTLALNLSRNHTTDHVPQIATDKEMPLSFILCIVSHKSERPLSLTRPGPSFTLGHVRESVAADGPGRSIGL